VPDWRMTRGTPGKETGAVVDGAFALLLAVTDTFFACPPHAAVARNRQHTMTSERREPMDKD